MSKPVTSIAIACFVLAAMPRAAWAQECRSAGDDPDPSYCLCNVDPATGDDECIPTDDSRLDEMFEARDEDIDERVHGNVLPETFVPDCEIVFEFLLRDAGFDNVFGWYNVTGEKPAEGSGPEASDNELFPILDSSVHTADWDNQDGDHNDFTGNGHTVSVDIANDSRYAGGEIGFFLKAPQAYSGDSHPNDCPTTTAAIGEDCGFLYFSERRWNDDVNPGGDPSYEPTDDDYIHLLTYNSTVDQGFYFAWEDLYEGGDNDFTDIVTYVSNIVCSGAGGPCDVPGEQGICAQGVWQCQSGVLECVPQHEPREEQCNGLDDDCDGLVDNGEDLCPAGHVCRFGDCIPQCAGDEFPCPVGRICVDGICIEPECEGVECDPGQRCVEGACVDGCTGVACPQGQRCDPLVGGCVDPCAGVTCEGNQVCVDGVCQAPCECHVQRCEGQGLSCGADGRCYDPACENVTCDEGFRCEDGDCINACTGVSCPEGQACWLGECVTDDGTIPDGGVPPSDGGVGPDGGPGSGAGGDDGCDCSVPGSAAGGLPGAFALALLAGAALFRRRRR